MSAVAGDFNGDGLLDVAMTNADGNSVVIMVGDGHGGFQPSGKYAVGSHPVAIAATSFPGNPLPDLIVINSHSNDISFLANRRTYSRLAARPDPSSICLPGVPISIAIEVFTAENTLDTNFTGTVRISSSDSKAQYPSEYSFTAEDRGRHYVSAIFGTPGPQRMTVQDAAGKLPFSICAIKVIGPAETHFRIVAPKDVTAEKPFRISVKVMGPFEIPLPRYLGTIQFSSSARDATLPPDFSFTHYDNSEHVFEDSVMFPHAGEWTITVADSPLHQITGKTSVVVKPAIAEEKRSP